MAGELSLKIFLKNDLESFLRLLLAKWKRKLILSVLLNILFIVTYHYVQTHLFFFTHTIDPSLIDSFFKFNPHWSIVYLSLFIYIGFGTLTIPHKKDLDRFIYLFFGIFITAIFFFIFLPTQIIRPELEVNNFLYNRIIFYDRPLNCFPSLHSSFCLITCFLFYRNSSTLHYKRHYRLLIIIWSVLIMIAILKTKQHYFIDLMGGLMNATIWIIIIYFSYFSKK